MSPSEGATFHLFFHVYGWFARTMASAPNQAGATSSSRSTNPPRSSKEHLDILEENVNKTIDNEVDTLLRSYKELVSLATIADKDKYRIAQESFQAEARADTMVRSVQYLSLLSESLKLSFLLSKSPDPSLNDEALDLIHSTELEKVKCAHLLQTLLGIQPDQAVQLVSQVDDTQQVPAQPDDNDEDQDMDEVSPS